MSDGSCRCKVLVKSDLAVIDVDCRVCFVVLMLTTFESDIISKRHSTNNSINFHWNGVLNFLLSVCDPEYLSLDSCFMTKQIRKNQTVTVYSTVNVLWTKGKF